MKLRLWVVAILVLAPAARPCLGQQVITYERPVRLSRISGVVFDPSGAAIPESIVELRDSSHKIVVSSIETDRTGYFLIPAKARHGQFYLRISSPGFNICQYTVILRWFGRKQMKVILPVAA